MNITFQSIAAINDELVTFLVADLTGEVRRLSSNAFKLENTLFRPTEEQAVKQRAASVNVDIALLERVYQWSDFKLLAMDMDSTVINIECIDEIADMCGKKHAVSEITEAAMRGEITDFNESLRRRLAILAGTDAGVLQRVLDERLQLNQGAENLIKTAHTNGLETLLVSGGFTFFTDAVKKRLNLTHARSNALEIIGGCITGNVTNTIVNAQVKADTVKAYCDALNVPTSNAICMGDGANDLTMMGISGLSVAYHAKPRVQEQAMIAFNHVGLDGLNHILG